MIRRLKRFLSCAPKSMDDVLDVLDVLFVVDEQRMCKG